MTPKRYTVAAALEAPEEASAEMLELITNQGLANKYGKKASVDATLCAIYRTSIRNAIFKSWEMRREIATETFETLSCYKEEEPFTAKGLVELKPTTCNPPRDCCCLTEKLHNKHNELAKLEDTIKNAPGKAENVRSDAF